LIATARSNFVGPRPPEAAPDCIRLSVTKPTEWQRIGNQIDAAMIFAWADFVNVFDRVLRAAMSLSAVASGYWKGNRRREEWERSCEAHRDRHRSM
jgi:hypothetical protein